MVIFFSVLLILVGFNMFLFILSIIYNQKRSKINSLKISHKRNSPIYPLSIIDAKYKKAI